MTKPQEAEWEDHSHPDLINARRDPRLGMSPQAVIAGWHAAMDAAERTRMLMELGLPR